MSRKVHDGPHKYGKRDIGSLKVFYVQHCYLKGCTHYLTIKAAINQESICWKCDKPFSLTRASSRLAKPRCLSCKEVRKKEVLAVDRSALANVLGKMLK
jgi:hypothetical protein